MKTPDRKKLTAKLHVLKAQLGLDENSYSAFLDSFGVASSKDLTTDQLVRAVMVLEKQTKPDTSKKEPTATDPEADVWRKRVMAAVGAWLRNCAIESTAEKIKTIACRAAGVEQGGFNKIPVARLRNIYYEFKKKNDDHTRIKTIKAEEIHHRPSLN